MKKMVITCYPSSPVIYVFGAYAILSCAMDLKRNAIPEMSTYLGWFRNVKC
jgi:hypothetical protein